MVDTRTWDDRAYAAYMRGRRGEPELIASSSSTGWVSFGLIVESRLRQTNVDIQQAIHATLTQIGISDAAALGFSLMPGGAYRCARERKFEVDGRQVVIPAGTDIVQTLATR
ncbi:MAG: hypothetical protein O7G84_13810 [Gammaproteobacteria bacterium]|nr:hypothetical protein [Gammaproteobacteria bacterium]